MKILYICRQIWFSQMIPVFIFNSIPPYHHSFPLRFFHCYIYISKSQLIIFVFVEHTLWTKDYVQPWAYNGIQENPQTLPSRSLKSRLPMVISMSPALEGLPWFFSLVYILTVFYQHCTFWSVSFSTLYGNCVHISSSLSIHKKCKPSFIFKPQQHLTQCLIGGTPKI